DYYCQSYDINLSAVLF
nr:immunoglobulin light chain junction region [Macaca mulatta]MOX28053.1 immunoglobulin light chain junction region [Macaca mulatta]MOX28335.1 immunoglobulin light chain junction region [Macaca mulatta]MOX28353.1 immunoglobulin light chain junction region [Macaca mulatta]MOX28400.1 immunoglobulin light chain junction region [Macaca mulatta]